MVEHAEVESASFTIACIVCSMMTIVTPSRFTWRMMASDVLERIVPEPRQGLVEQQEPRPRRERPRELHQAELLGRQPACDRVRLLVREPDARQRRERERFRFRVGRRADVRAGDHVLEHRHARERAHHLERAADALPADLVRLQADEPGAFEPDAARRRARGTR